MSTASFHARIERINHAHTRGIPVKPARVRKSKPAHQEQPQPHGLAIGKPSKPMARLLLPMSVGGAFGVVAGLTLLGATSSGSVWGPGTPLNAVMLPMGLGGLALAPMLMLAALMKGGKKPGLSLLALSYLSGLILVLLA